MPVTQSPPPPPPMSSEKRLAPGFRQVDAFDPDDNYECDENGNVIEEVSYVTLDLGAVEPTLVPSSSTYRLIVRGHIPCSLHSTRLIPFRAWIHQLRFYSSLARFSRAYTSHCLVLSSSSPRTKVRFVDTCIRVLLTPTYQTSTIKQGVKQPTSLTLLNAFASSKSRSGQKTHLHMNLWAHQPVERARVLAVSRNRTPWVTTISWT
jgi:hypothetical protein